MKTIHYKVVIGDPNRSVMVKSDYILYYPEGETVVSEPHTFGIFVFKAWWDANNFARHLGGNVAINNRYGLKIIEVIPIGKKYIPKSVSATTCCTEQLNDFYRNKRYVSGYIPKGTACYPSVYVVG